MVRARPEVPAGHGEVLARPDLSEWASLVDANRALAETWEFRVGGLPALAVRELARVEALERARSFSARLGVPLHEGGRPEGPIVATGHQPELYHPGVWVKDFLLERISKEAVATGVDLVVDTDSFDAVRITAPCLAPQARRCIQYLAVGAPNECYACAPVPSDEAIDAFCDAGSTMLASLPAPAVRRHFGGFCDALRSAAVDAANLAELVTFARRRYEASAGTGYLELPVSLVAASSAFSRLVAHIALDAASFRSAYNAELAEYRASTRTRSSAQPFPDLRERDGSIETPLWFIHDHDRSTLWVTPHPDGRADLTVEGTTVAILPADPQEAASCVQELQGVVAPKALVLTMYVRLFVCDLFIHGVGGARYDRVTDGLIRRYFGVEPPRYAVASMTMYLPLGAHVVTSDELSDVTERLNTFEHNPDQLLDVVEFDTVAERERAFELAGVKSKLLADIASPGADKKSLGRLIREVNDELREALAPVGEAISEERSRLEAQRADSEIFTDRTYPFALWSAEEVADKVR